MLKPLAFLPLFSWLPDYQKSDAIQDTLAAVIVTLILIPQSLAYAMVAGLPPVYGLYASIFPLLAYTVLGTSKTLSVGPVAVVALMTAGTLTGMFHPGSPEYINGASLLAALSGGILLIMALFKLGFLTHFISHPVLSGFMTASGILIVVSQSRHLFGISAQGTNSVELLISITENLGQANMPTILIGFGSLTALIACRAWLARLLTYLGVAGSVTRLFVRLAPVAIMLLCIVCVRTFHLDTQGVSVVGTIPGGLPSFTLPAFNGSEISALLPAAFLISLIGFVGSASVAQTLAAKGSHKISPDQELIALGSANIVSALSCGFPVTGGLSRSVVNYDAGASTPLAGTLTAIGISIIAVCFTPVFQSLPQAVLAAIIIAAVSALIDFKTVVHVWKKSTTEGISMVITILGVLLVNIEAGLIAGVAVSVITLMIRTSRPHIAVVGLMPGSHHFRNVERYPVETDPTTLTIRIDESLHFANAQYLEEKIPAFLLGQPEVKHLILMCTGVNDVDISALDSLKKIISDLDESGVTTHFSEVKGPVMDILRRTAFTGTINGNIYLDQYTAYQSVKNNVSVRQKQKEECSSPADP